MARTGDFDPPTSTEIASWERGAAVRANGEDGEEAAETNVAQSRSSTTFDRERAIEAGRLSGAKRRERKAEREAGAELDRLALAGRVSTAMARKLPYARIERVIEALAAKAETGDLRAVKELRDWLDRGNVDGGAEDGEAKSWGDMSPAQRASARAQLMGELESLQEGTIGGEQEDGSVPSQTKQTPGGA